MTVTTEFDSEDLRAQVRGMVLFADDPGFGTACQGFNLAVAHQPDLVVRPHGPEDVAAAIRYAQRSRLEVHVQATGHGFGEPAAGGLLIHTAELNAVAIDPDRRRACVGAGALWADVIEAASPHGLAPLNGSSVTVGVVGYTLGGGMGPMGRTFGFAADHVQRIQMVTADGEIVEVHAESEPELFWGLRGGKCSVGIVTEIEFDLMPVPDVYGGAVFYPGDAASAVLHAYGHWVQTLPDSTTASIALLRLPDLAEVPEPLRGKLSVHLRYVHVGDDAEGAVLLAPMREVCAPLVDLVDRMPYAQIGSVHQDPIDPMPAWDGSVLLHELPPEAVDALLGAAGPATDVPLIIAEIRHLGGALVREQGVANAVGGRGAGFSVGAIGPYPPPLREAVEAAGVALLSAMAPWATGGTQINFQGFAAEPDKVCRAWEPDTLQRLRALKQAWDPEGRFRFGYSMD